MNVKMILMMVACACALLGEAKALKGLMIGNSFTVSAMKQTPAVAKAMGCELDIANLCIGGCPLQKHWANVEKAGDPSFQPYSVQMSWTSCDEKTSGLRKVAPKGHANIPQALTAVVAEGGVYRPRFYAHGRGAVGRIEKEAAL